MIFLRKIVIFHTKQGAMWCFWSLKITPFIYSLSMKTILVQIYSKYENYIHSYIIQLLQTNSYIKKPPHISFVPCQVKLLLIIIEDFVLEIKKLQQFVTKPHRWCNGQCGRPRRFQPTSDQSKEYKIDICCFSAQHAAIRRKSQDWLARNLDNVSEWGDIFIRGLLFQ